MNTTIIDKIKKLLALTNSSNENEALVAAQKASELMLKYGIEQLELESNSEEGIRINSFELEKPKGKNRNKFNGALGGAIARFFNSRCIWFGNHLYVIASKDTFNSIQYLFKSVKNQIYDLTEIVWIREGQYSGVHGKAWKNSFRHGMLSGIKTRLWEEKAKLSEPSDSRALVVFDQHKQLVDAYVNSNLNVKSTARTKISSTSAYRAGQQNAGNIAINSGASIGNTRRIEKK